MIPPGERSALSIRQCLLAIAPVLAVTACSDGLGSVTLRVTLPENIPITGAELVFTPFNIASLADSLTAAAVVPPPDFSALEREMSDFRPQGSETLDSLRSDWQALRSDIVRLADSLSDVPREAAGYAQAYERLRALHAAVTASERDLERRMSQLVPPETVSLARRATVAADSLRAWETVAFESLAGRLDSLVHNVGPAIVVPLPVDGVVQRRLANGNWWVALRLPHPKNPFLEYYWETSFRTVPWIPVTVPLGERHLRERWRH